MSSLRKTTASELMQTEVITLHATAPIAEAVQTFEEYNIKGAPVVDSAGNLVGVLTATDIARSIDLEGDRIEIGRGDYYLVDPLDEEMEGSRQTEEFFGKEDYSPELLGTQTVGDWMTSEVIAVEPDISLKEVCQVMHQESVHRLLVVKGSRILGIISTLDVVRFIAEEG